MVHPGHHPRPLPEKVSLVVFDFDGVMIHGAHGYLISSFLSPLTNLRTDEYGGKFENRMRFALEVIHAVRKRIGEDFTLGVRLNADEMHPLGGLILEDSKK
jgi:2,4-dienoyl-CoA reductase-like NADH-dependent reductase (Old Yellow Enzyme family)